MAGDALQAAPVVQLRRYSNAAFQAGFSGDVAVFATRELSTTTNRVFALDAATGATLWTYAPNIFDIVVAQPYLDYGNRIFVASYSNGSTQPSLRALSILDGTELWTRSLGDIETGPSPSNGHLIVGNRQTGTLAHNTVVFAQSLACAGVPHREEIVVFRSGASKLLLIKIVKAEQGDSLALAPRSNGWILLVNGKTVRNSRGRPYELKAPRANMLKLYIRDYGGRVPPDTYLVLGDRPEGTLDSSRFGLIHRSDVVAKVTRIASVTHPGD